MLVRWTVRVKVVITVMVVSCWWTVTVKVVNTVMVEWCW